MRSVWPARGQGLILAEAAAIYDDKNAVQTQSYTGLKTTTEGWDYSHPSSLILHIPPQTT